MLLSCLDINNAFCSCLPLPLHEPFWQNNKMYLFMICLGEVTVCSIEMAHGEDASMQGSYTFSIPNFQTQISKPLSRFEHNVHRALFTGVYLAYTTVICKYIYFLIFLFFIDFLGDDSESLKQDSCMKKLFMPSRNYSHVQIIFLHAYTLKFLV